MSAYRHSATEGAWGLAIRPAGAGGHFWLENAMTGYSVTYQGDVNGVPLHQDGLTNVPLTPPSFTDHGYAFVTGTAYNSASDIAGQPPEFQVGPQDAVDDDTGGNDLGNVTGTAKFVFCTQDGCINAWLSNTATAMTSAPVIINYSKASPNGFPYSTNCVFTGIAMTQNAYTTAAYAHNGVGGTGNLVFAVDQRNSATSTYGEPYNPNGPYTPVIEVFDDKWNDVTSSFHFQTPASIGGLHPFNIIDINHHLFVTYCEFNPTGDEGQEQTGGAGLGHIVEYNEDGSVALDFNDGANTPAGVLDEPWGVAIAPSTFGPFGGDVLVANFDSDTIAAFDPNTGNFVDYLRDQNGNPITVDGIWGLTFGNGQSLGDVNSLYFSAGPNSEYSGLFGKLTVYSPPVDPTADTPTMPPIALIILATGLVLIAGRLLPRHVTGSSTN